MELQQLLRPDCIIRDVEGLDKAEVLRTMIGSCKMDQQGALKDKILKAVWERERLGSTAVGRGVAFPHARAAFIKKTTLLVAVSKRGLEFGALDNSRTHVVFLLLLPLKAEVSHLGLFSKLATLFLNPSVLKTLLSLEDENQMAAFLSRVSENLARKDTSSVAG